MLMKRLWIVGAVVACASSPAPSVQEPPPQHPAVASAPAPVTSSPPVEHDDPASCVDPPELPPADGKPKKKAHADAVPSTFGSLPPDEIRAVVRASYDRVRPCYEAGLARDPKLAGRVGIRFVIERDGKVSSTRVADCTLPDCEVARCVRDELKSLTFPEPEGGVVSLVYPLMLEPG